MAFDPNEARDERGRWTGSGPHPSGVAVAVLDPKNIDKADAIAKIAAGAAKELDFDPKFITVSDEHRTFTLNGKELSYAGAAFLDSHTVNPEIAVYTPHVTTDNTPGVIAHEIAHQKYQAFLNDYRHEYEAMQSDPDYKRTLSTWSEPTADGTITRIGGADKFMKPDGSLHEPYASRYPAYTLYQETQGKQLEAEYAKSDGVSGYSRDWWDARGTVKDHEYVKDSTTGEKGTYRSAAATSDQAMHETIAEIARIRYETKLNKDAHEANVKYIKDHGGTWTAENEKEWRSNQQSITHIVRKSDGFLTTRKGIDPMWNALHKAVEANWKRRWKK